MNTVETDVASDTITRSSLGTLEVTVLAGGPSAERDVSLQSGQSVAESLRRLGHKVELCDIGPENLAALDLPADFVFVTLHGAFGEDGQVQAELDRRCIPYCGTGVAASKLAMDKAASKRKFAQHGVPTPEFELVTQQNLMDVAASFDLPAFVKPVASGSSVDTFKAFDRDTFQDYCESLVRDYGSALVEKCICGPELTVGILGQEALPVCEIRTKREFYDYKAKYLDDDTEYLFDLTLPVPLLERVQALSLKAHESLGCEVFSRVDWMIDAQTLEPYALEVNTIPGFTSHSLLPKSAARIGVSFDQLCDRIMALSMKR